MTYSHHNTKTDMFCANGRRVKAHSVEEACRPDGEARDLYARRLAAELSRTGLETAGLPYSRGSEVVRGWIDPLSVVVDRPELSTRHSFEDMVDFAVENRGGSTILFESMDVLSVDIYPTPIGAGPLLKISANGHHRRMVFATLGHSAIGAEVRDINQDDWTFKAEDSQWLPLFDSLGLASSEAVEHGKYFLVHDPTRCVGWVLPPDGTKPAEVTDVILSRMRRLESVTGRVSDPRVEVLRSRRQLNAALVKHLKWSRLALWIVQRTDPMMNKVDATLANFQARRR